MIIRKKNILQLHFFTLVVCLVLSCKKEKIDPIIETNIEMPISEIEIIDTVTYTIGDLITRQDRFIGLLISNSKGEILFDSLATESRILEDWVISFSKKRTVTPILTIFAYRGNNLESGFENWSFINPIDKMIIDFPKLAPFYGYLEKFDLKISGVNSVEKYILPGAVNQTQVSFEHKDSVAFFKYDKIRPLDQNIILYANNETSPRIINVSNEISSLTKKWAEMSDSLRTISIEMPFSSTWWGDIYAINETSQKRTCLFNNINVWNRPQTQKIEILTPTNINFSDYHLELSGASENNYLTISDKIESLSNLNFVFEPQLPNAQIGKSYVTIDIDKNLSEYYSASLGYNFDFINSTETLNVSGRWNFYGNSNDSLDLLLPELPESFLTKLPYLKFYTFPKFKGITFYSMKRASHLEVLKNPFLIRSKDWRMTNSIIGKEFNL